MQRCAHFYRALLLAAKLVSAPQREIFDLHQHKLVYKAPFFLLNNVKSQQVTLTEGEFPSERAIINKAVLFNCVYI